MQLQHRLDASEQARLVASYLGGGTVANLASRYHLHRGAVSEILSRYGVTNRPHGSRPRMGGLERNSESARRELDRLSSYLTANPMDVQVRGRLQGAPSPRAHSCSPTAGSRNQPTPVTAGVDGGYLSSATSLRTFVCNGPEQSRRPQIADLFYSQNRHLVIRRRLT
jgi:hypothetical protein